jgi:hypothetical protein
MGDFKASFLYVDGLDEAVRARVNLTSGTLVEAEKEALAMPAPDGANFIDIYHESIKKKRIGVAL